MKLLLDTHALLWALADDKRLSPRARALIVDPQNIVMASAVSAIEIVIKKAIGKLRAPSDLKAAVDTVGFEQLPFDFAMAEQLDGLPAHHKDPFDRMLVAQALAEQAALVSRDPIFIAYPITVIW